MKPIDTSNAPDFPYGKILLLVIIIFVAVVVSSLPRHTDPVGAEPAVEDGQDTRSGTDDSGTNQSEPETQTEKQPVDINLDRDYQDELIQEVRKTYDSVKNQAQDKTEDVTNDVLGVAQEKVEETASRSAQTIKNTIYRSTIGQLILQLIDSMPEEAWEEMKPEVCEPQKAEDRSQETEKKSGETSKDTLHGSREKTEEDVGNEDLRSECSGDPECSTEVDGSKPAQEEGSSSTSFEEYDKCFQEKIKDAETPEDYQRAMDECSF